MTGCKVRKQKQSVNKVKKGKLNSSGLLINAECGKRRELCDAKKIGHPSDGDIVDFDDVSVVMDGFWSG